MAEAVVVDVVVAVEVAAARFPVAEAQIERGGTRVLVIDTQTDPEIAALHGEVFGGADDGGADTVRPPFGRPDRQAVDFGAIGEATVHLWRRAALPPDLAGAGRDVIDPRDQERGEPLLVALKSLLVPADVCGRRVRRARTSRSASRHC